MSKNNWPEANMLLKTSNWGPTKSFSLMPITNDCPYVEALYNPQEKVLAIIGKSIKDTFHMIPRVDSNGEPETRKGGSAENPYKKQRVQQQSYTEYYLTERSEIEEFLKNSAVNHETFNYAEVMDKETMSNPDKVAKGPQLIIEK